MQIPPNKLSVGSDALTRKREMGAEGREPSGVGAGSWELEVGSALLMPGISYARTCFTQPQSGWTTKPRVAKRTLGVRSHHAFPTAKRLHNKAAFDCVQRYHAHSL
jgi:hypothetical protein